ncbi:MAG: hypothetical protein HZB28_06365 [Methylocystis sp.]|nr:hypothetical protein [Methylocystis sp.]
MSLIEGTAKRLAEPLISGSHIIIEPSGQLFLSSLFCLIAIRFDLISEKSVVPPTERDFLRKSMVPSENWMIYISKYNGIRHSKNFARAHGIDLKLNPLDDNLPNETSIFVSTMIIGHVCIHILYNPILARRKAYRSKLLQIWPAYNFAVDTRGMIALNDEKMIILHDKLANYINSRITKPP